MSTTKNNDKVAQEKKGSKKEIYPENRVTAGSAKEDNLANNNQSPRKAAIPHSKSSVSGTDDDGQSD